MIATGNKKPVDCDRTHALARMLAWEPMPESMAYDVASAMLDGRFAAVESAAILTAMQMRGESIEELCGFVRAVRQRAVPVTPCAGNVIDTCGTGGSGLNRVNISTAAAIVAAAAGCKVAKHGNRSASSRTGSSDVVDALGITLDDAPDSAARRLVAHGITFLHAPHFHPGLAHVAELRRTLGFRTIFNLVGPLANPAGVKHQLVGVSNGLLLRDFAETLRKLGARRVLAVHGSDGADEITLTGPTSVCELRSGTIREYQISPDQFGFSICDDKALRGGDAAQNASAITRAFENRKSPIRDVILLNAGAAIYVSGFAASINDGVDRARDAARDGRALAKLDEIRSTRSTPATREATA